MAYFTHDVLHRYADQVRLDQSVSRHLKKAMTDAVRTRVFLSHSHSDISRADPEDVEGARGVLAAQGVDIYVDSEDPEMPGATSSKTAEILKVRIKQCDRFIVLATSSARNSKWVPWELGFADEAKGVNNIAIFPVAESDGKWSGNEYMGLYPQIRMTDNGDSGVFPPGASKGTWLERWLQGSVQP